MTRPDAPSARILTASSLGIAHLVDDNLVQPGWSRAGDHVASTLVPIAVVVLLAVLTTRGRTETRAKATLVLGLVGLMFGSEAVYHATHDGLAGDDWTGLLSLAAGAVLVGSGGRAVWSSRRQGGSRLRRYARRAAKAIGVLLLVVEIGYPVYEAYHFTNATTREAPAYDLGVPHEDVSFPASDGVRLDGWYVPSQNGAAVVLYPGRRANQRYARMFIDHGYGVLLFDHRGVGESDGEPNSLGWGSEHDVHGAVDFLQQRPDVDRDRIGAFGLSVGGEVILHAASEDDGLRAVVSEGAGMRSFKELDETDGGGRWLATPVMIDLTLATSVFNNRMPPPGLHELVPRIEVPALFIYASQPVGGEELTIDYHRLASGPKELWRTDSDHTGGLDADPAEYERRVVTFLDDALLG